MGPTLDAFLGSWPFEPWLLGILILSAAIYLHGWRVLRRRDLLRWPVSRPAAFAAGLTAIALALASPLEPFAGWLLHVHMIQHQLLMMVAPPLLWLGAPLLPMLRGLPGPIRTYWVAPFLGSRRIRRLFQWATHPSVALPFFVASTWLWHVPTVYEAALRSTVLHRTQHAGFLLASLLFWYPVVRPFPSRPRWSRWLLFPYLILADISNTVLSALLTFSDRVIYGHYETVPRLGGWSALDDQAAAGVIMWVPGSLVFLVPLFVIGLRLLFGAPQGIRGVRRTAPRVTMQRSGAIGPSLPVLNSGGRDVTRLPLLGRFLRWRHARLAVQLPLAILAGVVVVDGLRGPAVGPLNLAGVLPWIHWRGLVVLGLLAAGNVSCMACPFVLPRALARRWLPARLRRPRWLRTKWPAVFLLLLFLWTYEAFSLWDRPAWTAAIVLGYFAAAFLTDGLFGGASFCKHVCPIGQFNFVYSQASPLDVGVRDPTVCASCRTHECLRGRDDIPGCELGLFQPKKSGSLDCTFCLDCLHACPHDNVGILLVYPTRGLVGDAYRSGIGRLSRRVDLGVLTLLLVFGGFANAAGMVGPVQGWQDQLRRTLGVRLPAWVTSALSLSGLLVLGLILHGIATVVCRRWGRLTTRPAEVATRFAQSLVPLGFAMWLAHQGYHFVTGYATIVPTSQRFLADLGWPILGTPEWGLACCRPVARWLLRAEIIALQLGMLASLYTAYRITLTESLRWPLALRAFAPWALLILSLFAAGIWIILQPMQMRGTLS